MTKQLFRAKRVQVIVEFTLGKPIGEADSCAMARREWADHDDTKPSSNRRLWRTNPASSAVSRIRCRSHLARGRSLGDLPKTCHLLPSTAILEPQSRYARFNCSIRYLPREGMPANVGLGLRTASGAERSLGGTKYPLSQLPNATPFEEHRQVAIFADLENRSVQRCGQAGQGSRTLDRAAQL